MKYWPSTITGAMSELPLITLLLLHFIRVEILLDIFRTWWIENLLGKVERFAEESLSILWLESVWSLVTMRLGWLWPPRGWIPSPDCQLFDNAPQMPRFCKLFDNALASRPATFTSSKGWKPLARWLKAGGGYRTNAASSDTWVIKTGHKIVTA